MAGVLNVFIDMEDFRIPVDVLVLTQFYMLLVKLINAQPMKGQLVGLAVERELVIMTPEIS